MKPRLVIIEDDPQIRRFLRSALAAAGYEVFEAETGERGLAEAAARRPDAILLDLGLPDIDGIDVLGRLRKWTTTPIVILSARGQEEAKVAALDSGADDYVVKPFSAPELLARLRAAVRRWGQGSPTAAVFQSRGVRVDLTARRVERNGEPVHLTPTEFKLLGELVRRCGQVLTQKYLLRAVWGPAHAADSHYLRLYMSQLRAKLEDDPTDPRLLLTEQGVGYRLADDSSQTEAAPD